MEQIKNDAKRFSEYSSSAMNNVNFTINKQIYSHYSKNLHYMRGNFMMNMFISQQNSDFFDIPSAPSLFQSVYMKVTSMLVNYPAMFIQNLTAKIQKVYESPIEFAATVDLFFQEDITDVIVFAYSTFPAIYSFFLTEEFCSSASLFLTAIFKSSRNQLLSELLLSSFFLSGTVFYDHFFSLIGDYLFELTSKKKNDLGQISNENNANNNQQGGKKKRFSFSKLFESKNKLNKSNNSNNDNNNNSNNNIQPQNYLKEIEDFFPIFIQSLKTCLPLLSRYHIQAFRNFHKTFPESSHKFFLQKVLLTPFQTAAESSTSLVSPEGNKFFIHFLETFSDYPSNDPHIKTFLCTAMNTAELDNSNSNYNSINLPTIDDDKNLIFNFHDVYPSLKGFVWNHGVPVLFSHIDVKLFIDILKFTNLFNLSEQIIEKFKINFTYSFETAMFNVFPFFCATKPPEQGIGIELFGKAPPSLEMSVQIYKDIIDKYIKPSKRSKKNKSKSNNNNENSNNENNNNENNNNENNNNKNNNDENNNSKNDDDEEEEDEDDDDENMDMKSEAKKRRREIEKMAGVGAQKKRIFMKINAFANDECEQLIDLVFNPPPQFSFVKDDVSFILLLMNRYHENFTSIERAILMEEAKEKMNILVTSARNLTHITYHHFSFSFLKKKINNLNQILPAINDLINPDSDSNLNSDSSSNLLLTKSKVNVAFLSDSDFLSQDKIENRLPSSVMFEISMTALDTLILKEGTKKIEMIEAVFEDELMMWIEDEWPSYKDNEIFVKRLKNIESLAKFFKHVQKGGYGRRLKIIINFVQSLKVILTTDNLQLWKPAFKYAVFISSQKQIFSTFLYIHHFFIQKLKLDNLWDTEIQNLVSMFTAGMWSILDNNVDLNVKYADFNYIKNIFYP